MCFKGKEKLVKIIEKIHLRFFRCEMSDEMRKFLDNLSWSFFGGVGAAGIMFCVQIIMARLLGLDEFGRYNALLSFATGVSVLFLFGNDVGSVRYLSDKIYKKKQGNILTSSAVLLIVQAVIFGSVIFVVFFFLRGKIEVTGMFLVSGIIFATVLACKTISDSYLRALDELKKQGIIRIIDAVIVVLILLFFISKSKEIIVSDYVSMIIGGAIFFIFATFFIIRHRFGHFSFKYIKLLLHYNKFIVISVIGGVLISFEKLFIGNFIGLKELGIFSAYYASSQLIISNLTLVFMNAFMPAVIKNKSSLVEVLHKLKRMAVFAIPIIIILNIVLISFFIFLFGEEYKFDITLTMLFAVVSVFNIVFAVLISILNIDRVKNAAVIFLTTAVLMTLSIVVFRDIRIYLCTQGILYGIFSIVVILQLNREYGKK